MMFSCYPYIHHQSPFPCVGFRHQVCQLLGVLGLPVVGGIRSASKRHNLFVRPCAFALLQDGVDAALALVEKVCSSCAVAPTAAEQHSTPADQQSTVEKLADTSDADAGSEAEWSSAADVDTAPRTSLEEELCCPAPAIGHDSGSSNSSSGDSC